MDRILWQWRKKTTYERRKIFCLCRGIKKEDPSSDVLIEQAEEGKSIATFSNSEVRPLIEKAVHIYDSTVITITYKVN